MGHGRGGFVEFYETNKDACLRAVAASVVDPDLAEEAVAEAFARAWRSWATVSRHPSPAAWVVRTALNVRISWWRRRRRELPLASHDEARVTDLEPDLLAAGSPRAGRSRKETMTPAPGPALARDGWCAVGVLERPLTSLLLRAVDEVAAGSPQTAPDGQLHLLSGLSRHPDLAEIVDWPPLLALVLEMLSPNVYINHSHLDVHPPHPPSSGHRWHRDNGLMGRDMRQLWCDQPRVTLKAAIYLTEVRSPDDGALEVVPGSHLDAVPRAPTDEQPRGLPIVGPAGTVTAFDARLWHRRRDNLGPRTRRAIFLSYSYRWLTSRDVPFDDVPGWAALPAIRRQLLGEGSADPFYWSSGRLALQAAVP